MSMFGKLKGSFKDLFKGKPKEAPTEEIEKVETPEAEEGKPAAAKKAAPRPAKPAKPKPAPVVAKKPGEERLSQVILGTRMSEKSVHLAEQEQYVFEVLKDATRDEVKYAVEAMFDVKVDAVRMTNVRGKVKRQGRRNDWSKAYVRLAPGQNLEGTEIGA